MSGWKIEVSVEKPDGSTFGNSWSYDTLDGETTSELSNDIEQWLDAELLDDEDEDLEDEDDLDPDGDGVEDEDLDGTPDDSGDIPDTGEDKE